MPALPIRPLESIADFHAAENVQREVWPGAEAEIVPLHVLKTVAQNGGAVLGAFDGAQLVGFVFGFLGTDETDPQRPALAKLKHCSHLLAVLPAYRDQGVGRQLKLAQHAWVHAQGVRLITWTYDPLEARNARLNISSLGATCHHYQRDAYGAMLDGLNAGLPSDRFLTEWWVTSHRVKERIAGRRAPLVLDSFLSAGAEILNPTQLGAHGWPQPTQRLANVAGLVALVEIPADFQALKAQQLSLAREWRTHTRQLFEALFQNGYWVTDFLTESFEGRRRAFYALSQIAPRIEYSEN